MRDKVLRLILNVSMKKHLQWRPTGAVATLASFHEVPIFPSTSPSFLPLPFPIMFSSHCVILRQAQGPPIFSVIYIFFLA